MLLQQQMMHVLTINGYSVIIMANLIVNKKSVWNTKIEELGKQKIINI